MDIKVSVIVPVYNRSIQIENCIKSLLNQSLRDIEIIVINDGSTDCTETAVKSFSDKRVRLITTDINMGQGISRNMGIDAALGEYIGFADSDDTAEPYMYECMYKRAKEKDADMVQCSINYIWDKGTRVSPKTDGEFIEISHARYYVRKYFHNSKHTNEVCNKIFKADFLRKNNLRFSDTKKIYSEDMKFNIGLLEKLKRVCFINEPFYNYYMSDSGHFRRSPEERLIKTCRLYEDALKNIHDREIKRAVKSTAVTQLFMYITEVIDTKSADYVLKSALLKRYELSALRYRKDFKYSLFILLFIFAPLKVKKAFLKKMYEKYL